MEAIALPFKTIALQGLIALVWPAIPLKKRDTLQTRHPARGNHSLTLMRLEAVPMRRLLRPVPAHRHAAPATRMAAGVIGEEKRASGALTGLHMREIFRADKTRQPLAHRQQQRFR